MTTEQAKKVIKTCEFQINIGKESGKQYACVVVETVGGKKAMLFFNGENKYFPDVIDAELSKSK